MVYFSSNWPSTTPPSLIFASPLAKPNLATSQEFLKDLWNIYIISWKIHK
jgi:hypothetical protein